VVNPGAGVTNDMLVIIEPGTPSGFSNVLEARTSILDHEGRRAAKLQKRLAAAANDEPATQHSGSSGGDAALAAKADSKWFGAHVVAPCPHDSPCPLAVPGRKSWCHFGTRFQRPGFLQQAKAPAGARMNAADHQDELHSYVVLRWVPRGLYTLSNCCFTPKAATNSYGVPWWVLCGL
jgi:ribosomal protein RSM22 (predicted rRNA methylase)